MIALPAQIRTKRISAKLSRSDGTRALVDRLWPRGIAKEQSALHAWLKHLGPSEELKTWFQQNPESWAMFRKRYLKELHELNAVSALEELHRLAAQPKRLTLLFASKDEQHNNAVVLREVLEGIRKPPTGTGPGALRLMNQRQSKRMSTLR